MEDRADGGRINKPVSIALGLAIIGTIIFLIYSVFFPPAGESFSIFYILNSEGDEADYPAKLQVGENTELTLGIINQEHKQSSYNVEIRIDNTMVSRLGPITLDNGEKYEQAVSFTPDRPGDEQKVEFLLFKQGQSDVYRSLHIYIDVRGRS